MIREDLTPGARNAFLFLTPSNGLAMQNRASAGGTNWTVNMPADACGEGGPFSARAVEAHERIGLERAHAAHEQGTASHQELARSDAKIGLVH